MAPVVVAVAATAAGALVKGAVAKVLVAMAVSYIGNKLLASQQRLPDFSRDRQHIVRSSTQSRSVIYGRAMVSGPLAFAYSTKKAPGLRAGEYLHLAILLAGHEIDAVEEVYFDDKPCTEWDKFGARHTVRIGLPSDDYGTMGGLALSALVSITIDGVTYNNTGSTVQEKLEAAGFEVWHDHWVYIRTPSVGVVFTVSAVTATKLSWQPTTVAARAEVTANGDSIYFWRAHLGTAAQTADPDLVAQVEEWTTAHRLRGIAYLYVRLRWHPEAWKNGIPNIKAVVRGKKILDPRTGVTAWSRNAALCALDWVRSPWGIGAPDDEIDMPSWIAAANVCDESEVTPTGTQTRYTADGVITLDMAPTQALEQLRSAMAGGVFDFMGRWYGYAGADIPATVTLTEDDLRGPIRVRPRPGRQQLFNAVRGTYVDPGQHWAATEFPPVTNAMYQEEDAGEQIFTDIELPFTTDPVRAQRIAKIDLERARQGITVEFPAKLTALRVRPWVPIRLSIARLGWEEKLFTVKDWKLSEDFGIDLTLQEYASGVWDWNSGSATTVDLAPNTNLPDPFDVSPPANVTLNSGADELLIGGDGTLHSRIRVSWEESGDAMVASGGRTEIEYRRSDAEGTWKSVPAATGIDREAFIAPVIDGAEYDVRVRHMNSIGVASEWVTFSRYRVEGKMAAPADVTTFGAEIRDRQIYLYWSAVPDLDVREYEIRRGGTDWYTAEFVCRVAGTDTYREAQAGPSTWRIKAVDTSENPSENDAVTTLAINVPSIKSLTAEVIDNNVLLRHASTAGTLPISHYEIRRGASWESAIVIGTDVASFTPLFETVAGDYTYWLAAVDIAGNYSTPKSVGAHVMQPPDYVLNVHWIDDLSGAMTNLIAETGQLVGSIDTTETWEQHFTSRSWDSPQDQIDAGYPLYAEPSLNSAQYVRTFDYGAQLGGSMVTVILAPEVLVGAPVFSSTIEVSADGSTWTTYAGVRQVYAALFRYVRVTIDVAGAGVYRLNPVEVQLGAKKKSDAVSGHCQAGKAVSFDGSTGYGVIQASETIDVAGPFTMVFDFRAPTVRGPIVEYGNSGAMGLHVWAHPTVDTFFINLGSGLLVSASDVLFPGRTYRAVIRYDGNAIRILLDGREIANTVVGSSLVGSNYPLHFAYRPLYGEQSDAAIKNFRLFGRAVSDDEMLAFSKDIFTDLTGERVRLLFTEGAGATVEDSSGNGNTCTLVGGYTWIDDAGAICAFNEAFVDVQAITPSVKAGGDAVYALYDLDDKPYPIIFRTLTYDKNGNRAAGDFSCNIQGL